MADSEIGALPVASTLDGTEKFHLVQGGNSRYGTPAQIRSYLAYLASEISNNSSVSGSTVSAALNTLLASSTAITTADVLPVSVKTFGAVGDSTNGTNGTDDTAAIQAAIDYCFGSASSPHGTSEYLNKPLYFPPGWYKITAELDLTRVRGARIFGAGTYVTRITQNTSGQSVFVTNGCSFGHFSQMLLEGPGDGEVFDLNWDGTGSVDLKGNTFDLIRFRQRTGTGGTGLAIGADNMGSENLILDCWFDHFDKAIHTGNFNALQNTMVGGNIADCVRGIHAEFGQFYFITSVGFQTLTTNCIQIDNQAGDGPTVIGCRTETCDNFLQAKDNNQRVVMINNSHKGSNNGYYADIGGADVVIEGGYTQRGLIQGTSPRVNVKGVLFGRSTPVNLGWFTATAFAKFEDCWINDNVSKTQLRKRLYIMDPVLGSGNQLAIDEGIVPVKAVTTSRTITAAESGFSYSNAGATALIAHSLPTAVAGLEFTFTVMDTDGIQIIPAAGDNIRLLGSLSTTGTSGHIDSTVIGASVKLRAQDATTWVGVQIVGAVGSDWTVT